MKCLWVFLTWMVTCASWPFSGCTPDSSYQLRESSSPSCPQEPIGKILVGVLSNASNNEERNIIRNSWFFGASAAVNGLRYPSHYASLSFLFVVTPTPPGDCIDNALQEEARSYGDILIGDSTSRGGLRALLQYGTYCGAELVVKVDPLTVPDMDKLVAAINDQQAGEATSFLMGSCLQPSCKEGIHSALWVVSREAAINLLSITDDETRKLEWSEERALTTLASSIPIVPLKLHFLDDATTCVEAVGRWPVPPSLPNYQSAASGDGEPQPQVAFSLPAVKGVKRTVPTSTIALSLAVVAVRCAHSLDWLVELYRSSAVSAGGIDLRVVVYEECRSQQQIAASSDHQSYNALGIRAVSVPRGRGAIYSHLHFLVSQRRQHSTSPVANFTLLLPADVRDLSDNQKSDILSGAVLREVSKTDSKGFVRLTSRRFPIDRLGCPTHCKLGGALSEVYHDITTGEESASSSSRSTPGLPEASVAEVGGAVVLSREAILHNPSDLYLRATSCLNLDLYEMRTGESESILGAHLDATLVDILLPSLFNHLTPFSLHQAILYREWPAWRALALRVLGASTSKLQGKGHACDEELGLWCEKDLRCISRPDTASASPGYGMCVVVASEDATQASKSKTTAPAPPTSTDTSTPVPDTPVTTATTVTPPPTTVTPPTATTVTSPPTATKTQVQDSAEKKPKKTKKSDIELVLGPDGKRLPFREQLIIHSARLLEKESDKKPPFKGFDPELWMLLVGLNKWDGLGDQLVRFFQSWFDSNYITKLEMDPTYFASMFMSVVAFPTFDPPQQTWYSLLPYTETLSNLLAMTPFRSTDPWYPQAVVRSAPNFCIGKQLFFLSMRNNWHAIGVNMEEIVKVNMREFPEATMRWITQQYAQAIAMHEQTVDRNIRLLQAIIATKPDWDMHGDHLDTMDIMFGSTYISTDTDRALKTAVNQGIKALLVERYGPTPITSYPARHRIAVVTNKWNVGTSTHRAVSPLITALKSDYHITLVHLLVNKNSKPETELFDHVIVPGIKSCFEYDISPLLNNDWSMVIFPDVGMNCLTTGLTNLRIAPIQAVLLGHLRSPFATETDYFFTGEGVEIYNDLKKNYKERAVLLPGTGLAIQRPPPIKAQEATAPRPLPRDPRNVYVACAWSWHKITYDLVQAMRQIITKAKSTCGKKVVYSLYTLPVHGQLARNLQVNHTILQELGAEHVEMHENSAQSIYIAERASNLFFLDSFKGGFSTYMDGFLLRKPYLSMEGSHWFNRVGPYMQRQLGLHRMIVNNTKDYVARAVQLVCNSTFLTEVQQLMDNLDLDSFWTSDGDTIRMFKQSVDYIIDNHKRIPKLFPDQKPISWRDVDTYYQKKQKKKQP